jgi:hypothetical protein
MSNTQHAKWTEAEVTAASAERLLGDLWDEVEGEAFRRVIVRGLAADLTAAGAEPGVIAAMDQACLDLGTGYWADLYHDFQVRSA